MYGICGSSPPPFSRNKNVVFTLWVYLTRVFL